MMMAETENVVHLSDGRIVTCIAEGGGYDVTLFEFLDGTSSKRHVHSATVEVFHALEFGLRLGIWTDNLGWQISDLVVNRPIVVYPGTPHFVESHRDYARLLKTALPGYDPADSRIFGR